MLRQFTSAIFIIAITFTTLEATTLPAPKQEVMILNIIDEQLPQSADYITELRALFTLSGKIFGHLKPRTCSKKG
jgi:hypothetical protein